MFHAFRNIFESKKIVSVLYQVEVDNDCQDWLSNTANCRMIEQLTYEECDWGRGNQRMLKKILITQMTLFVDQMSL